MHYSCDVILLVSSTHYPWYVLQKIIGMYYRDAIMAMLAWLALSPEVSGSNSAAADAL